MPALQLTKQAFGRAGKFSPLQTCAFCSIYVLPATMSEAGRLLTLTWSHLGAQPLQSHGPPIRESPLVARLSCAYYSNVMVRCDGGDTGDSAFCRPAEAQWRARAHCVHQRKGGRGRTALGISSIGLDFCSSHPLCRMELRGRIPHTTLVVVFLKGRWSCLWQAMCCLAPGGLAQISICDAPCITPHAVLAFCPLQVSQSLGVTAVALLTLAAHGKMVILRLPLSPYNFCLSIAIRPTAAYPHVS